MAGSAPRAPSRSGITYQQLAQTNPSLLVPMRREFEAYLRDAPLSDPSVPAIRQILEQGK